jgi:hypothetical protein
MVWTITSMTEHDGQPSLSPAKSSASRRWSRSDDDEFEDHFEGWLAGFGLEFDTKERTRYA